MQYNFLIVQSRVYLLHISDVFSLHLWKKKYIFRSLNNQYKHDADQSVARALSDIPK